MPGIYEWFASGEAHGPLLAAWIIEGKGAGAGAVFSRETGGPALLFRDDAFPPALAEFVRMLPPGETGIVGTEDTTLFLEQISGGRKLVICGGGHVALSLVRLAVLTGFDVTVIEDREEYAMRASAAGAPHVVCRPFGEALDRIEGDGATAFVVMTREHAHDMGCLRRILGKSYAYAGMMGSRSRSEGIRNQLLEEGYDARKVRELHMPIGLPIGSRTPEEIAVSVTAELISVMNASDPGESFPPGMAEELAGQPRGVLAMIVEKQGEAPRKPGTRMLVRADGSFLGTVGGGYAEAEILRTAGQMIREGSGESRLVTIGMKKGTMHCGGEITVLLLPLAADNHESTEKGEQDG